MILTTERLILRPIEKTDFEAMHEFASDIANLKYLMWGPNTEADTQLHIEKCMQAFSKSPIMQYNFAVCLRENNKMIGDCEITREPHMDEAMIGWLLNGKYWKNGYGTELAEALIKFGFEELKLHRIYATCDSENIGSYRIMENNSMRKEGLSLKCRPTRSGYRDEFLYAILEEEYESRNKRH